MTYTYLYLTGPSVSLNAPNVANVSPMKYHPRVPWSMGAHEIIKQYVSSAYHHLVFNCHGFVTQPNFPVPHLSLGTVFHAGNVSAFDPIASYPLLKVIWLTACNLGSSDAGKEFIMAIAAHSRCYVVGAFTAWEDVRCPPECILDPIHKTPFIGTPSGGSIGQQSFRALAGSLGFLPL
jgi:hypothetical protein